MRTDLEKRMKENYENRSKIFLPRRTYALIRVDQKRGSKYTKKLNKPFDQGYSDDMNETALYLCQNLQGVQFAYTQSDEISLLITDFENINSQMLFDGNVQKIASISASMTTAKFNQLRFERGFEESLATFDSRVFIIPDPNEVFNYFVWRQKDCERNSLSMAARAHYSHKELKEKSGSQKQDMLMEKGVNWNDYPIKFKRGNIIKKEFYLKEADNKKKEEGFDNVVRSRWVIEDPPIFTQNRDYLNYRIPLKQNTFNKR